MKNHKILTQNKKRHTRPTRPSLTIWLVGTKYYSQPRQRLVDVLVANRPHTILKPPQPSVLEKIKKIIGLLTVDTRQQYHDTLGTTAEGDTEEHMNVLVAKQNLVISFTGFALATIGLAFPIFKIGSMLCLLYAFRTTHQHAYRSIIVEKRIDYYSLLSIMLTIAMLSGYIWTAGLGIIFVMLSRFLVMQTEYTAKQSITNLFDVQIRSVWRVMDGVQVEVPFEQVQVGDIVVVHAGHIVPVDGVINEGMALVDQHMLTGEAQPVEKGNGDTVLASTVILSGLVFVEVGKTGQATVAAQIGQMLTETDDFVQLLESRSDTLLNQLLYPILGLSALVLPIYGLSSALAVFWCLPGTKIMLYAPLNMLSSLQMAANQRLLIKDGRSLEILNDIDTVIFDKTGTLTLEQLTVTHIYYNDSLGEMFSEEDILCYAAVAETKQTHPIARAILQAAHTRDLTLPTMDNVDYKVGYGLKVLVAGHMAYVGSTRFMDIEKIAVPPEIARQQETCHAVGNSLVMVALDGLLIGAIELQPTIRPEAKDIVQSLHARGLDILIISGDHEAPTRELATRLGIKNYFAEVLPEDKSNIVQQLQQTGHSVCFVGDGINDSIALRQANVSVSMRGATTIATDAAQIVLMDGSLGQMDTLFEVATEFRRNSNFNITAAMAPGVLCVVGILLFGWGYTLCTFLSQTSTPFVLFNSLRPLLKNGNEGLHE